MEVSGRKKSIRKNDRPKETEKKQNVVFVAGGSCKKGNQEKVLFLRGP